MTFMYLSDKANFTYSSKQTLLLVRILFILHYSRKFYFTFGCGSLFCEAPPPHDDRKGHHYYTRRLRRPRQLCIVVMTLAVIMLCKKMPPTLTFLYKLGESPILDEEAVCLLKEGSCSSYS